MSKQHHSSPIDYSLVITDGAQRRVFHQRLRNWFRKNGRDLPWRRDITPYRVWVSEIMLQQTQVDTVIPYFRQFVRLFPSIEALANSNLDSVLSCWEGLGYYRRAKSLHRAAQVICDQHGGQFPPSFEQAIKLPGVGRYTAGAILSIAYDERLPILEGNTIRLFTRLANIRENSTDSAIQRRLWELSEQLLPKTKCGEFNQALMELGNQVCKRDMPGCSRCPLRRFCRGLEYGNVDQLPMNGKQQKITRLFESLFIVRRKSKLLVRKCEEGERWAGLYDFPRLRAQREPLRDEQLLQFLQCETGLRPANRDSALRKQNAQLRETDSRAHQARQSFAPDKNGKGQQEQYGCNEWLFLDQIVHYVTRYKIHLEMHYLNQPLGRLHPKSNYSWLSENELKSLPLNKSARTAFQQWQAHKKGK